MSTLDDAKAAIAAQKAAEDEVRRQQTERDALIVRLAQEEGWNPPRIGRELGLSPSTIRLVLRLAGVGR